MLACGGARRSHPRVTQRERFISRLQDSFAQGTFVRLTLSRPRAHGGPRNLYGRRVELKNGPAISFTLRHATRDVTQNEEPATAVRLIGRWIDSDFAEAHLFTTTGDWTLREAREGEWKLKAARPAFAAPPPASHDRPKTRALTNAEFLVKLGVTAADGSARPGRADKLRQIERFVEILGHLVDGSALRDAKEVRVCDMGAGRGYLTFAAHAFLHSRGVAADVTGVEQRPELVEETARIAATLQCEGLRFVPGAIGGFPLPEKLDILIALHACDTATDDAIAAGVRAGAALIVVAPCCHKEVRAQFTAPPVLAPVLRHGILAGRQAELLTDGIRALALEAAGYETKVFEFIATDHTAKNVMLAATRRAHPGDPAAARAELAAVMDFFGLKTQRLATLLAG